MSHATLRYHPLVQATMKAPSGQAQKVSKGISVVGLGNWGSSLLEACRKAKIATPEVVRTTNHSSNKKFVSLSQAKLNASILWLCVPDGMITKICAAIVAQRPNLKGQIVMHSSGALGSEILAPAKKAGAVIASVHPLMSFPTRRPAPLKGVFFAVETENNSARRKLNKIVRELGGSPFPLHTGSKAIYHAAGTLSSPLLLATVVAAEQLAIRTGLPPHTARKMVGRIAKATVENYIAQGAGKSFSGPFARGDFQTIALHLRALQQHPSLARVYRELAWYALEHLPSRNRQEIERLLAVPRPKGSTR
jgi:predicted short-subunit dehydrogenase-like oxidoreductase (DUF2520 family)